MSGRLIIVAGHGRCGSSLVMQMLAAAGLRCAGRFPSFEHEAVAPQLEPDFTEPPCKPAEWFDRFDAIKVLLPHRVVLPTPLTAVVIWLDRGLLEQSKSQLKTMRRQNPTWLGNVPEARILEECRGVLAREREAAIEALIPAPRIEMRFEDLIRYPLDSALAIREFASQYGHDLDAVEMASVVISRPTTCAPAFAIERSLLATTPGQGSAI